MRSDTVANVAKERNWEVHSEFASDGDSVDLDLRVTEFLLKDGSVEGDQ